MTNKKRYSCRSTSDFPGSVWEMVGLEGKTIFTFTSAVSCSRVVSALNKELDRMEDDPSKDLVGTVRKSPAGELWIRRNTAGHGISTKPWYMFDRLLESWSTFRTDDEVLGWETLSPVEHSPAWKVVQA